MINRIVVSAALAASISLGALAERAYAYTGNLIETRTLNCSAGRPANSQMLAQTGGSGEFVWSYTKSGVSKIKETYFTIAAGQAAGDDLHPADNTITIKSVALYYSGLVSYDPTSGHFLDAACY